MAVVIGSKIEAFGYLLVSIGSLCLKDTVRSAALDLLESDFSVIADSLRSRRDLAVIVIQCEFRAFKHFVCLGVLLENIYFGRCAAGSVRNDSAVRNILGCIDIKGYVVIDLCISRRSLFLSGNVLSGFEIIPDGLAVLVGSSIADKGLSAVADEIETEYSAGKRSVIRICLVYRDRTTFVLCGVLDVYLDNLVVSCRFYVPCAVCFVLGKLIAGSSGYFHKPVRLVFKPCKLRNAVFIGHFGINELTAAVVKIEYSTRKYRVCIVIRLHDFKSPAGCVYPVFTDLVVGRRVFLGYCEEIRLRCSCVSVGSKYFNNCVFLVDAEIIEYSDTVAVGHSRILYLGRFTAFTVIIGTVKVEASTGELLA